MEGDVADVELQRRSLAGVDTVYHLAAAHLGASVPRAEFWRVNVNALRDFLEESGRAGVRRFVHCSSVGVYGRIENPPADEDTPCRPDLPYEESKLEGERVVLRAVADGVVQAVVLRPVWVYGPGCHRTEKLCNRPDSFPVQEFPSGFDCCGYSTDRNSAAAARY